MYKVKQVHFEPTQLCQASCPMCDRNKNGGDENQYLSNASITFKQFKQIFSSQFVQQLDTFYMCGNHGDPILNTEVLDMFQWLRSTNPKLNISMTTNGGAQHPSWWEELGKIKNMIVNFSIDGLEDTNHLYRQGVSWKRVEENMDAFISAGGYAKWTFLVFNYNEHQVEEAEIFSKLIGVKDFIVKKSGRYVNTHSLEKKNSHQAINRRGEETALLSQPTNPKYQNKAVNKDYDIIVKDYGSMDNFIELAESNPKCVEKKEIYVSAEGHVFPCCWLNGQLYKWWRPMEESQEYQVIHENGGMDTISAYKHSINDIVNGKMFNDLKRRWDITGCNNGRMRTCGLKCNVGFDPFRAQWQ